MTEEQRADLRRPAEASCQTCWHYTAGEGRPDWGICHRACGKPGEPYDGEGSTLFWAGAAESDERIVLHTCLNVHETFGCVLHSPLPPWEQPPLAELAATAREAVPTQEQRAELRRLAEKARGRYVLEGAWRKGELFRLARDLPALLDLLEASESAVDLAHRREVHTAEIHGRALAEERERVERLREALGRYARGMDDAGKWARVVLEEKAGE